MKTKYGISAILLTLIVLSYSCSKSEFPARLSKNQTANARIGAAPLVSGPYCYYCGIIDSMPPVDYDGDSIERPTILGMQHVNPYLIPNMQQAYANLGITNVTVNVTNLYVRFLPNSVQQLATLDSTLDVQGLDLFDAPMDYDVLQEGDYYQDPSIPDSLPTYQYAVVPPNFQFPAGIAYTVLAQIHIPADAYTAVETEAERLAAIQDSLNSMSPSIAHATPNVPVCPPGTHWDYTHGGVFRIIALPGIIGTELKINVYRTIHLLRPRPLRQTPALLRDISMFRMSI